MTRLRAFASLALLTALLSGCAAGILRAPEPIRPEAERIAEEHLEIHRVHHRMAIEAHEAAVRLHAPPPPPPAPAT